MPVLAALWLALAPAGGRAAPPARVVSLNLCTDQLAMMMAAPGQLLAVSHLARDPRSSAMAAAAKAFPATSGQAEDVFRLDPELVLAGIYTTPVTVRMLERLGVRVERFAPAASVDEIVATVERMGRLLGREARAAALVRTMRADLATLRQHRPAGSPVQALFLDANSYTAGAGTLVDALIRAAGMRNIAAERGLVQTVRLSLEELVLARPDVLITAQRFDPPSVGEAVLDHPALGPLQESGGRAVVAGNLYTCGTPLSVGAVRRLAAARDAALRRQGTP